MKFFVKALAVVAALLYPVLIYITLSRFSASPRVLAAVLVFVALVYFLAHTEDAKAGSGKRLRFWGMFITAGVLAFVTFLTDNAGYVKFYPVSINIFLLISFGSTLFSPPTMIFRLASLQDKSVRESTGTERREIEKYCRKVTIVWVSFFIFNGLAAVLTALFASQFVWAIYNGMISYILIGLLFAGEILVRKLVVRK